MQAYSGPKWALKKIQKTPFNFKFAVYQPFRLDNLR